MQILDSILQRFAEHPQAQQLSYIEHACQSLYLSYKMGKASLALLIHAIFPMYYSTTGSDTIRELHDAITPLSPPPSPSSPSSIPVMPLLTFRVNHAGV